MKRDVQVSLLLLAVVLAVVLTSLLLLPKPPHDFWHDLAPYQAFLGHTRSIARKARMVDLVPPTVMAKHKDSKPFLKLENLL